MKIQFEVEIEAVFREGGDEPVPIREVHNRLVGMEFIVMNLHTTQEAVVDGLAIHYQMKNIEVVE